MRVGICIVPFGTTYLECREAALAAEASGFESVWTWDHLLSFNDDEEPVLECWTLLAALAEATQRVKLGSFVANVLNRAPDVLAKTVATVQQVSGGQGRARHRRRGETQGAGRIQQALPGGEGAGGTGGGGRGTDEAHVDGRANQLPRQILQRRGRPFDSRPRARASGNGRGAGAEVGEERCESWGRVELRGPSGMERRGEPEIQAAKATRAGRAGKARTAQGPVRDIHLRQAGRHRALRSARATRRGWRRKGSTGLS